MACVAGECNWGRTCIVHRGELCNFSPSWHDSNYVCAVLLLRITLCDRNSAPRFDALMHGCACLLPPDHASLAACLCVGDLLLQHKEHAELLQSYDERRDAAVSFIQAVRPELRVQTAALKDPQVHAVWCLASISSLPNVPHDCSHKLPHNKSALVAAIDTSHTFGAARSWNMSCMSDIGVSHILARLYLCYAVTLNVSCNRHTQCLL